MVNLIGMDREKVKEAFVFFLEDCKLIAEIIEDLVDKSNETTITSDILNKALNTFEKKSSRSLKTYQRTETHSDNWCVIYEKFGFSPTIKSSISVYGSPFFPLFVKKSPKKRIYFNEFISCPTFNTSLLTIEPNDQHIKKITSTAYKTENNYIFDFMRNEFVPENEPMPENEPIPENEKHYPSTLSSLNSYQPESDIFNSESFLVIC